MFATFLIISEKSKKESEEANKKAQMLLQDVKDKYPDKISFGKFRICGREREGFLVKGELRNYFLDKKQLGVYSYPQGRYICIVDGEEGRDISRIDRMINRIYLLINDNDLKIKVGTLEEENMFEFGGEFDEIDYIG